MNDGQIEQILGARFGIQGDTEFEFIRQHPRKGARVLDEQVLVTLAYHVAQSVIQRGQKDKMQRDHARGDVIRE